MDQLSYVRDPWNLVDLFVVGLGYIMQIIDLVTPYIARATMSSVEVSHQLAQADPRSSSSGLTALRAFRVLRVLKTMSIVPGLRPDTKLQFIIQLNVPKL